MTDKNNAGDQIAALAERLRTEAATLGLTLRGFTFAPNMEGGPHMVQAVFYIDEVAEESDEADGADIVAGFEEMLRGQREADHLEAVNQAKEAMRQRLAEGGDILDD